MNFYLLFKTRVTADCFSYSLLVKMVGGRVLGKFLSVSIFLSLFYQECFATIPRFFRGRLRGGMLGAPNVDHEVKLPKELWFTQRLTHFNDANEQMWKQRYWYNSTFWKPGGPVFIMIGGEGEANPIWIVEGTMMKYAEELGAFAFLLEHRFYGQSHPLGLVFLFL